MIDVREIRHFHLFGAIGGGADGFNKGEARLRTMFDPAFDPMWPLVITDELAKPIIRTHGGGDA